MLTNWITIELIYKYVYKYFQCWNDMIMNTITGSVNVASQEKNKWKQKQMIHIHLLLAKCAFKNEQISFHNVNTWSTDSVFIATNQGGVNTAWEYAAYLNWSLCQRNHNDKKCITVQSTLIQTLEDLQNFF